MVILSMNAEPKSTCSGLGNTMGFRFPLVVGILLCLCCTISAPAQVDAGAEYKFKAVYLYNFLQFVEWPKQVMHDDSSPIIVAILGNDLLDSLLEQIVKNEKIKGHPVTVHRLSDIDEMKTCHVLFISRTEEKDIQQILKKIKGAPILAVSEAKGFARMGGAINFYFEDKKLRFEINLDAVKTADLVLSSKLLRLAKIVESEN